MEPWLTTVLSLIGSTIISTIVSTIVKNTVNKRMDESESNQAELAELHRQQRKEDVLVSVRAEIAPLTDEVRNINNNITKISDGTLCSLRNDILTCYYKCNEKGYRNDYDYKNIHDLDEAYLKLGGNTFIADVMDRFDKLPTKEEIRKKQKKAITDKTNKGE